MRGWKRTAALGALAAAAWLSIVIYGNYRSYYASKRQGLSPELKITALGRANGMWPVLDGTLREEGKAHLDRALELLPDTAGADRSLRLAEGRLRRSLRLNPASAAGHLLYSRTLRYLNFLSEDGAPDSLTELWKAARLTGKKSPLDFDLCLSLLEHWSALDERQREHTLGLTREVLRREKSGQFSKIMQAWSLHVGDDGLLEESLPDSPKLLRAFARQLGEKSGSLEMRRRLLAKAERIDYDLAVRENDGGNPDAALRLLDGIHYYAALQGDREVAPEVLKHGLLRREALLNRAKARLMKSRRIEEAEADLRAYLELEDKFNEVLALESFLREIGILHEESFVRPNFNDLQRLAFEMFLMFKLNKYEAITALGEAIQGGVFVAAGARKGFLVEVYSLIADAYDKLNFIYEPEGLYRKALELDPGNRAALLKLRRYYDRLNEQGKLAEVERTMALTLSPSAVRFPESLIPKGGARTFDLALRPGPVDLTLSFEGGGESPGLLTTVLFNNRVVWEDFLSGPDLSLNVEAGRSVDRLTVAAVNRPLRLRELRWVTSFRE